MNNSVLFKNLFESLSTRPSNDYVFNFYNNEENNKNYKLNNLYNYFEYFKVHSPKVILIGEAPGYKGCAQSGIPFTSQNIIKTSKFFIHNSLGIISGDQKENTATIMWQLFDELEQYPLLWNAFPFHPHHKNNNNSNRKPNQKEIEEGLYYIKNLISIYPKAKIVAVGNVAHGSLASLGIEVNRVRHPSYGGKKSFRNDLKHLLS